MRVALVHDWLTGMRGGERVLESFCEMFPEAPIYTLLHVPGQVAASIERHPIHSSLLGHLPLARHWFRGALPCFFALARSLDLRGYDLVLSSSHCVAKAVRVPATTCHLSYVHTPMRYIWDHYETYLHPWRNAPWLRRFADPARRQLQALDLASNAGVASMAANSRNVAERIRRCYGRDARVIHPPVRPFHSTTAVPTARATQAPATPSTSLAEHLATPYYLVVSALVPYKRVDLAVQACNRLQRRLIVIGSGPEQRRLQQMAGPTVHITGWQSDSTVEQALRGCRALLYPGEEDFGITPLEAMGCGRPVVALARGGALETVIDVVQAGVERGTGLLYTVPRGVGGAAGALAEAIERFEALEASFDPNVLRAHAATFGMERFKADIQRWIDDALASFAAAPHEPAPPTGRAP